MDVAVNVLKAYPGWVPTGTVCIPESRVEPGDNCSVLIKIGAVVVLEFDVAILKTLPWASFAN